jgi:hypothetical protein
MVDLTVDKLHKHNDTDCCKLMDKLHKRSDSVIHEWTKSENFVILIVVS